LEEQITTTNDGELDDIELTDEELLAAVKVAKEIKLLAIRKSQYWERITASTTPPVISAESLYSALEQSRNAKGRRYEIDADNERQVSQLCYYFAGDERFEGDLSKGIVLMGGLGVGKSHLMSFFFHNQIRCYKMVSCRKLEGEWNTWSAKNETEDPIEFHSREISVAVNANRFGHNQIGVCFDDLGVETVPSKRFGEEKNVMAEIILARYENGIHHQFTHFTTNLPLSNGGNPNVKPGIKELYGDRVLDRLKEMCNLITFSTNAKSRR
jgi:DNA replication protein DnaC